MTDAKKQQQDLVSLLDLDKFNEGITLPQLLNAIKQSEILQDGPIHNMHQAFEAMEKLVVNDIGDGELVNNIYVLGRLFRFYHLLASPMANHQKNEFKDYKLSI